MRNKFIIFVIILTLVVGLVGFWYYQRNIYTRADLKLEILGPREAELAQEIEYTVRYKNNGNIRLDEPRLIFQYPDYSITGDARFLVRELVLDNIYPGEEKTFTFTARLFGREGDFKKAQAWLSYQPRNLKARYTSHTSYTTQITVVPLTLQFDLPSKIESGKEITFRLNYFSNVQYPLVDLGIKVEYPANFEFKSASPQPLEEPYWAIGFLNRGQGGRITITGNPRGETGEQKTFKAQLGVWRNGQYVLLKETIWAVQIVTPSLHIIQEINRHPQYVASPGDLLHYEIIFKNIGREAFNNLFLVATLEGEAFDFATLRAPFGEFQPGANSIIFDWRRVSALQFLDAQEEGKVEFWINLKEDWQVAGRPDKNPVLKNKIYLSQATEEFTTKVNSRLELQQTIKDHMVTWHLKNYYNDVKNIKVRALLAEELDRIVEVSPADAVLTFDSDSQEVVWKLEELRAGRETSISFGIPEDEIVGKPLGEIKISGEDQWTGQIIEILWEI